MESSVSVLLNGVPVTSPRGALGWCNVVLIRLAGRTILFDTGSHGDRQLLLNRLAEQGLTVQDVDQIFLSHFHYDHVVNAEIFPLDTEVLISEREYRYVMDGAYESLGDPYVPVASIDFLRDRLRRVVDGEHIAEAVRAISLPGHTPGNMGLFLEEEKILLAGDAVKNGWEFVRNIVPPSFYSEEESRKNYERVKALADIVICGHDRPFKLHKDGKISYLETSSVELRLCDDPYEEARTIGLL